MKNKRTHSQRTVGTAKVLLGTVVALGLILSGCGGKSTSNAGGSSSISPSASTAASASPKPSASVSASPSASASASASPKPSASASASPAAAAAASPAASAAANAGAKPNVASGKTATSSTVWKDDPKYVAAMAFDGDPKTRWSVNAGDAAGFLQVDLGKEYNVSQVVINEYKSRITGYTIQVSSDGKTWTDAKKATKDAGDADLITTVKLDKAVKAKFVKLKVDSMSSDPSIYELEVNE